MGLLRGGIIKITKSESLSSSMMNRRLKRLLKLGRKKLLICLVGAWKLLRIIERLLRLCMSISGTVRTGVVRSIGCSKSCVSLSSRSLGIWRLP